MQNGHSQFEKWFDFLTFVNSETKNRELLIDYFFHQFAQTPGKFYGFILYFRNRVKRTSRKFQKELAEKYLNILSGLCERFGFFQEKNILDDLCFRINNPRKYKEISQFLLHYQRKSQSLINTINRVLIDTLRQKHFTGEVKGRYKNIYSIFRKIKKKSRDVLKLNDIFAFRIVLGNNSLKQCFEILNLLHDRFHPIPDFFKDYITIPKINGYQSLHTGLSGVVPELDLPIEVQIRTKSMDDFSEKGFAAHWLYAQDKKAKRVTEKEKQLLTYFSFLSRLPSKHTHLYCFSYLGDIFLLEYGSTLLDFAYHIHTDLGNKAKIALVNGERQPLSYTLREGDRIKILKSTVDRVNSKWLSVVKMKHSHRKISEYLRHYENPTQKIV